MRRLPNLTPRLRRALVALMLVVPAGACNDVLEVQRPTLITEATVKGDSSMITAMVAGVENEFREGYAWIASSGAAQTDEAIFSHAWTPWDTYDNRDVTPDAPAHDIFTYPFLQRARGSSEKFVQSLREALGERAKTHAGFARALAYAGYSHFQIAAYMCAIPVNGSAPKPPDEIFGMAIKYFEEAVTVGTAANARDAVNLANTGLARTYLQMGNKTKAVETARKVDPTFTAWVRYAPNPDFGQWTKYNLYNRISGLRSPSEFNLGLDPETFRTVNDLRVPFLRDSTLKMMEERGPRFAYQPYQPSSFSEWTPGGKHIMTDDADIRFASGLEARYMVAEAGGMTNGELRTFINERRAVGGLAPFTGGDAQLFDELLEQRKWEFFLAGFRMPDLIRYKKLYGKDLWPKGRMPGFTGSFTQNYGTAECWPIGATEKNGNPNIP
jgi:hypothetical protein